MFPRLFCRIIETASCLCFCEDVLAETIATFSRILIKSHEFHHSSEIISVKSHLNQLKCDFTHKEGTAFTTD